MAAVTSQDVERGLPWSDPGSQPLKDITEHLRALSATGPTAEEMAESIRILNRATPTVEEALTTITRHTRRIE